MGLIQAYFESGARDLRRKDGGGASPDGVHAARSAQPCTGEKGGLTPAFGRRRPPWRVTTFPPAELDVAGARIGIVAARFNDDIVSGLLEGALDTLARHGLDRERIPVARVPGAFELPLAARWLAIRYGSLTDTGGLGRPRERRRIVQEARDPR